MIGLLSQSGACAGRWAADLCSRLRAFETCSVGSSAADSKGKPSTEFTGMLQLLKATLQAAELFMDQRKTLVMLAPKLLLEQAANEQGEHAGLLESLINTLCNGAAISTVHSYKIAFILRICVARHMDWGLSVQLFEEQRLVDKVSSVLGSALAAKHAALAECNHSKRDQAHPSETGKPTAQASGKFESEDKPPGAHRRDKSLGSWKAAEAGKQPSAEEPAEVARRSAKAYLESVRAGMAADKAPAVAV